MLKVAVVHNRYQWVGGEDRVFANESALLRRRGHEVVEYLEDNRRIPTMSAWDLAADTLWARYSTSKLSVLLQRTRPNIVHFHNTFPLISPAAYYVARKLGIPVVQTLHNYRLLCPSASLFRDGKACEDCVSKIVTWPAVLHGCYRHRVASTGVTAMLAAHRLLGTWQNAVDVYIALSEFSRRQFIQGGLPADKIHVKPNFVAPDPVERSTPGNYALFVGRLSQEKGVTTLMNAWEKLNSSIPLLVIGDGPLRLSLESETGKRHLSQVTFKGALTRDETLIAMKEARFLVFPSLCYEGFPMVIGEAFACGIPVLCSATGAIKEIVGDQRQGLHFVTGDAEDLARKVEWAWNHPFQLAMMGRDARIEFETRYAPNRNYELLMHIYDRASHSHARIGTPRC